MPTNLAQARRNYYGGNTSNAAAEMDSGSMFYNANGSRTGQRIDGRVRRKTMMGGGTTGPISMRGNRSEIMEQEAEAEMERQHRRGIERARREKNETAMAAHGQLGGQSAGAPATTTAAPAGRLIPGSAPGSSIWVKNGDPRLRVPESGTAGKPSLQERLLLSARRTQRNRSNLKALQDRNFSKQRAEAERDPSQYAASTYNAMTRMPTEDKPGMSAMREEARRRGHLNTY